MSTDFELCTPGQLAQIKADLDRLTMEAGKRAEAELFRVQGNPEYYMVEAAVMVDDFDDRFSAEIESGSLKGIPQDDLDRAADSLLTLAAMAIARVATLRHVCPAIRIPPA